LGLISAGGFATVVTTAPKAVHRFWAQHQRVIYESAIRTRSIVAELDAVDVHRIPDVDACHTQFQVRPRTRLPGPRVDTAVLACRIESTATDYRSRGNAAPQAGATSFDDEGAVHVAVVGAVVAVIAVVVGAVNTTFPPPGTTASNPAWSEVTVWAWEPSFFTVTVEPGLTETGPWKAKFVMVMTTVAEVPAGLPVVDTAAIEEAAGEGSTVCSPAQVG